MYDTICTLPLTSDLFAQAIHPSEPIIAVGLASGHVQTYRLPALANSHGSSSSGTSATTNGGTSITTNGGAIETVWRTKRHKGSCRGLAFGVDGASLVSAGTDGIVKVAKAETGRVEVKIGVPMVG